MARGFGKLTAKKVEHLSKRGMHADGGGLYLQVAEGGSKSWLFRYKFYGRARWHGLGSLRDVSLEEAREKATDARKVRRNGGDPIKARREAEAAARGQQHPFIFMHATGVAWAYFERKAWEGAAQHAEIPALRRPNCFGPLVILAAISGLRGDEHASAQRVESIRSLIPKFNLAWLGEFLHLRSTELRDKAYEGLRAAGID